MTFLGLGLEAAVAGAPYSGLSRTLAPSPWSGCPDMGADPLGPS